MFVPGDYRGKLLTAALLTLLLILSGCGFSFGPAGPEPTAAAPTSEPRALVPTFTPSPVAPPTATPAPLPPTDTPAPAEPAVEPTPETPPTATAAPQAKLIVNNQAVNARSGPGTTYGLVGSAEANQTFDIVAKNPAGDWWQVCCINGQQAWIFGQLARTENADAVAVAADIPAPPVVAVQPTPPPAAPPAAPTPVPQVAAPPPSSDPCAGIGDDGCKFKLREGPKFAPNGGTELKLQLIFVHSGVEGGQPQGSYFVVVSKDGQKLPISDGVRSIAKSSQQGTLGPYNYEYKVGLNGIPGNTVAGNYVMYVLDGNGVRDSQDISFTIPEGQGEVWVKWDQG